MQKVVIIKLDWETVKSSFKPFRIWTVSITVSLLCTNLNSSMALFASCLTSRRVSRVLYKCGRWTRNSWQLLIAVKPFIRANVPLFVPWWLLFSFVAMCRVRELVQKKNFKNLDKRQIRRRGVKFYPNFLLFRKLDMILKGR